MYLSWRERLQQSPDFWDFNNWPAVAINDLPQKKRAGFLKNKRIAALVLQHHSFTSIVLELAISKSKISKLMSRCLAGDEEDLPSLTRGLVPSSQIKILGRHQPLSTLEKKRGPRGAFQSLLNKMPQIKEHLDKVLIAHIKDKAESQQIQPKSFFSVFLQLLVEQNWPHDCYPYTEQSLGYESVRLYMHTRLSELSLERAIARKPKRWTQSPHIIKRVFGQLQLDEHTYDATASIHLEFEGELKPLRISRVTLLVVIDVATTTILSYLLVLNRSPNQNDVLECLAGIYRSWKPQPLVCPNLEYAPESGFPCGKLFDETNAPAFGELRLDNALVHLSNSVRSYVVDTLGGTTNLGIPASPKDRNWVEYAFKLVAESAHRFRSTTGSHTQDPRKESKKNLKNSPIISLKALEETIEITLAHHNARSRSYLGGHSPLETMAFQLSRHYIPRYSGDQYVQIKSQIDIESAVVKYSPTDKRLPHINFGYVRYSGACLNNAELINKTVQLYIPRGDIRSIAVYKDGRHLGEINAPKSWQRFSHTLKTRICIFGLLKNRAFHHQDPLVNYFNYLLKNSELPKQALELIRVYREFSVNGVERIVPQTNYFQTEQINVEEDHPSSLISDFEFPEWSPDISRTSRDYQNESANKSI